MLDELSSFIIQEETSVFDAVAAIDRNRRQIIFVCDGMRLLGSLSDGDIRRYILRSGDVSKSVRHAANYNAVTLSKEEATNAQSLITKAPYIKAIPILDETGDIVSVYFSESEYVRKDVNLSIPVVIMAGGKGARLKPFTNVLPKPLIPIGDMTITEHIMERFLNFGCTEFSIIINEKKELIKAYFSETQCKGNLDFIDEEVFQGTAGGLKLIHGKLNSTFFLTNCDILVEADYEDILEHHRKTGALITMVCAIKKISVPYGTIELDDDGKPAKFIEKPEYPLLTNTGLYVIEPAFLDIIPSDKPIHMTDLIQSLIDEGKSVGIYPISENQWSDMGQPQELDKMISQLEMR